MVLPDRAGRAKSAAVARPRAWSVGANEFAAVTHTALMRRQGSGEPKGPEYSRHLSAFQKQNDLLIGTGIFTRIAHDVLRPPRALSHQRTTRGCVPVRRAL